MSQQDNIEQEFFQNKFNTVLDQLKSDHTVLVKYFGELNQDNIVKIENEVENSVVQNEIPKGPLKKIFFISVETLQNMLIHGQKNNDGRQKNFFILSKNHTKVEIISANLIKNNSVETVSNQIERINSFEEPSALKQFYMEHLENNQMSEKGGAGLGFITIAMKSGNKLKAVFEKIDDEYSLFMLISSVGLE